MKAKDLQYRDKFITKSQVKSGAAMLFERIYPQEEGLKDAEKEGRGILGQPCSEKKVCPHLIPLNTEVIKIT